MWTKNFQMFKLDFKRQRNQRTIANNRWITEKAREFQKNIYFCFIDYAKALTVWITTNCGKFFKRWEYQTTWPASWEICIDLKAGQEATVRIGHGTTDWLQIGKGVRQGCILSPCLFNLCEEYIMWNVRLDEAQAGIKIAGKNVNKFRYADDHHPYSRKQRGNKEPLDENERGEWKSWLKTQHSNIQSHHFMANRWERMEMWQILFSWAPKSLQMVTEIRRCLLLGRKAVTNLAY